MRCEKRLTESHSQMRKDRGEIETAKTQGGDESPFQAGTVSEIVLAEGVPSVMQWLNQESL